MFKKRFAFLKQPAILSEKEKTVLWPEYMPYEELMHRRIEKGEKIFNQEYLCIPTVDADAFFSRETIIGLTDPALVNFKHSQDRQSQHDVIGGFDIGKKAHPSHFAVFERRPEGWAQIHSAWFDGVDYTEQIEYLRMAIENFHIDYVFYDATRGELDALAEMGALPAEMQPVPFTLKLKSSIATLFDKAVSNKKIKFLDDPRQLSQICSVTNDLKAIESEEGHGDSFWSIALIFKAEDEGAPAAMLL